MTLTRRELMAVCGSLALAASTLPTLVQAATNLNVVKPKRLRPGMTVGLVTPASNVPEDQDLHTAMDLVRSLGFNAKPSPNLFSRTQYLAGTDKERADDLNAMFADTDVDAIFCVRGGYGSGRLLRYLDYDTIAANPKVIMGYSDITAILNAIYVRTGLVTFHGPIAGGNFSDYTYDQYRRVLIEPTSNTRIGEPPEFEKSPGVVDWENRLTSIVSGTAEGHLIGGNLSLMVTLLGTPYEPNFEGAILFLEDVSEPPYSVDRMLTHLWMAGKLEQVAGIVLGKFSDDGYDSNTFSMEEVLRDRFEPLGIPALRGAMIGHIEDKTVVPLGIRARLDADAGSLTLLEVAVS
ncbi:MAG: muramoyltetrapeptide carboxypeptidase [Pseudohongiellaceae bacterium]|jgi:muramoyltetrapeptide carboxypeptidase